MAEAHDRKRFYLFGCIMYARHFSSSFPLPLSRNRFFISLIFDRDIYFLKLGGKIGSGWIGRERKGLVARRNDFIYLVVLYTLVTSSPLSRTGSSSSFPSSSIYRDIYFLKLGGKIGLGWIGRERKGLVARRNAGDKWRAS